MPDGLHGIAVKDGVVEFTESSHRVDVEDITDLVVGVHQGNQCFLFAGSQESFQVIEVYMAVGKQFHQAYFGNIHIVEVFHRVRNSMVFDGRGDDVLAAQVAYRSGDGRVAALGSAAGKEYLGRVGVQDLCYGFTGCFDCHPGFPSVRIDGGGVTEFIGQVRHHGFQHLWVQCGGGGVVEIDSVHIV